jgi:RNase P/RNase MRP subunit p29
MKVTPFNLIYNDIVGLSVRVAGCRDPTQIGVEGKVVDETANTLVISTGLCEKTIPKRYSKFGFYIPQEVMVDGSEIAFSPEERLKRLQRRRL